MNSNKKNIVQATSRWVRVGVLSASALAPMLSSAVERIRAQQQAEQAAVDIRNADRKENVTTFVSDVQSDLQDRLQSIGTSLSDVLTELQKHSVNQDLLKRGNELTEDLKERSSKFSQAVAERSGEVSHQVAKRSRQAQKNIADQDRSFWIALGFGFGLTAASIVTFFLIRRRLQHVEVVEDEVIQLPVDGQRSESPVLQRTGAIYAVPAGSNGHDSRPFDPVVGVKEHRNGQAGKSVDELAKDEETTPVGASFVGLASTKLYYPVETPLDQLSEIDGKPVDVIYFASESEAQAQGFSAASL